MATEQNGESHSSDSKVNEKQGGSPEIDQQQEQARQMIEIEFENSSKNSDCQAN